MPGRFGLSGPQPRRRAVTGGIGAALVLARGRMAGVRPVEVWSGQRWVPGTLEVWRRDPAGWVGYVWWREAAGLQHVGWLPADRLRPVPDPGAPDGPG